MRPSSTNPSSRPAEGARPVWVRGIVLAAIWTLVLQPLVSSAQLAQSPMFTVTSAPPNVMLMFDDSSSMNRLDLNPTPAYAAPTASWRYPWLTGTPLLKINTVGYFGISGMAYYFGGQPVGGWTDGYWNFGWADVLARSPAFNPLAYNPAIQYLPWNNNGVRFPNSSIGGTTNVSVGAKTEWDPRNLPPAMGGGSVFSKLTAPNDGVIDSNGEVRSWAAPVPGSVTYGGLPAGNPAPLTGLTSVAATGADLFSSTIQWENPNCTSTSTPTNYFWYCPVGTAWSSPPETCDSTNTGMPSAARTCCDSRGQHPVVRARGRLCLRVFFRGPTRSAGSGNDGPGRRSVHGDFRHRSDQLGRPALLARCPC